ncbi:hypothetical protein HMPREF3293_01059 [Christensenella minuta]|uniref:Uncharacterized protein n=1 Tax=Christensenella minuta TaxID=626937 RepID=A0A136Q6Q5_9FIRM|nr:hypothetical protein HMPREF3293_01059 [Christensenella minuta]
MRRSRFLSEYILLFYPKIVALATIMCYSILGCRRNYFYGLG